MNILLHANYGPGDILYKGGSGEMRIREAFPNLTIRNVPRGEHTDEDLAWAEVIAGQPFARDLKKMTNLKWLHLHSAGVDAYVDNSLYANPDVILTRGSGIYDVPMAEWTLGMMIALMRYFPIYARQQAQGFWKWNKLERGELLGSTALILGAGAIGSEIAKRLRPMGVTVKGYKRTPGALPDFDGVYSGDELKTALGEADFVISVLPASPATDKFMNEETFRMMKPSAFFLNIGRGGTVDTNALESALRAGVIAGAALDVTDPEPLPDGHPLFAMENVFITPHCSGSSLRAYERRVDRFIDLLGRYVRGEELYDVVDKGRGY